MRLLIVEDERGVADTLCALLTREGYCADTAADGARGLELAQTGAYDAVLLDVMLPRLDGITVLQTLRRRGIATPVLLLTAKGEESEKILGLDAGADDYVTKPFQMGELLARIRALTRRKGELVDRALRFGDITLDRSQSLLSRGQSSVRLGRKELQLLEALMLNPGQIVTREFLIEKAWGLEDGGEYNNVEVYLSFLRRKLGYVGSGVRIKAVRGLGYSLEADA